MKRDDHGARRSSPRRAAPRRLAVWALLAASVVVAILAIRREDGRDSPAARRPPQGRVREAAPSSPDFVAIREAPSSAIAGTVRSSDGKPIEHARVCAVDVNHQPVGSPAAPCGDTTAAGLFSFAGLPAGAYFVRAGAVGFAPGAANGGLPVSLAQGESKSGLDIVLETGGARVSGVVLDATGGVVAQAHVRIARTPAGDVLDVTADDAGRFEAFLSTGAVAVTAQASGYAPAHAFVIAPASGLELVLTPGASLSGTVTAAENGQPVPNVAVRVVPVGGWGFPGHPSAVSGPEGTFTITGLEPGAYGVLAEGQRLRGENDGPFHVGVAEAVSGANIVVSAARRVVGQVMLKESGAPCRQGNVVLSQPENSATTVPILFTEITPSGAVVLESVPTGRYGVRVQCNDHVLAEGPRELAIAQDDVTGVQWKVTPGLGLRVRIVDQRDRPVPGYTFRLQLPHAAGEPAPTMMLTSDAEGKHDYPTILEPGRYVVAPSGNFKGDPVPVELREGMGKVEVALRLAGSGALMVNVLATSGEPIEGVTVVAIPLATAVPAASASAVALTPGTPVPASSTSGQGPSTGERAELTSVRTRAREGRVASPLGKGRYRIAPLEAGRYQVKIEDGVNPPADVGVGPKPVFDVVNGAELEARLTLDRGESIRGQVVDHSGGPLPNVWVSAIHEGEGDPNRRAQTLRSLGGRPSPGQRVLTDLDGRFRLFNLARNSGFALRAEDSRGLAAMRRQARPGEDVVIRFPATGELRGTLVASDGKAGELTVQATHLETGQTRALAILNKEGAWELAGIASGRVRLFATDDRGRSAQQVVEVPAEGRLDGIRLVLEGPPRLDEEPTAAGPTANE